MTDRVAYSQEQWMELSSRYLMNTYARQPLVIQKGEGSYVWDASGKKYLDFCTGLSVNNLGHRPKAVIQAIQGQLENLLHCSNIYYSMPSVLLAQRLTELTFAKRVFFCNSGAEANECAIKLARLYAGKKRGEGAKEIITMKSSFHGRTMGTLSATGQDKVRLGFEPYLPGFRFVQFGDLQECQKAISDKTAAIILEPIQAEGGIHIAPAGYLKELRNLCRTEGLLLIFDEVQTGMGRTGKFCAHEWDETPPDIMSMSKSLGGGLSLGACLATEEVAAVFEPGKHASTFGGNPLACAAGLAMVNGIAEPKLLDNCRERGKELLEHLKALAKKHDFIVDIRGRGLMIGIEFDFEVKDLIQTCLTQGLLTCAAGAQVLRLLPPLNLTSAELKEGFGILERTIAAVKRN